jgi:hypothetical protein
MLVVVLVWVCPGDAGVAGCAGTVKRGGMYEIIRKVKGHTFPESLVAQKVKAINELNDQNVAMQLQLDKMKAQQDKQNELIAWLMLPWWKRLFNQMPGVEQQENN